MTTYTSEPGTKLGGRYRLEDRIAAGPGWAAWKAIDETLARAVTVFTFAPGFPRVGDVVTAARAASRLTDPRVAQVFDVEDTWDRAYIVMEWAAGETLGDMLSQGPLDPDRAARMIAEAAAALAAAHGAGVAHMCLSPGSVRWSQTGEVKVVGLGIDAALSGITSEDPVLADTVGLGRLLYAALTGHWPGTDYPALPPAPVADGQPFSPRQVMAGVPGVLSDLSCRAMQLASHGGHGEPVTTPEQLAHELKDAVPPAPLMSAPPRRDGQRHPDGPYRDRRRPDGPHSEIRGDRRADAFEHTGRQRRDDWQRHDGRDREDWHAGADPALGPAAFTDEQAWPGDHATAEPGWDDGQWRPDTPDRMAGPGGGYGRAAARSGRGGGPGGRGLSAMRGGKPRRLVLVAGAVVLAAALAAALWPGGKGSPGGSPPTSRPGSHSPSASEPILSPAGAAGFDALNPTDKGNEESQYAKYAIDGNPSTAWQSQWYKTAQFGGLKAGTGLIIDMGNPVKISSVSIDFGSIPGADVQLRIGDSNVRSTANLDSMTTVGSQSSASGTVTFNVRNPVSGRYLVIWFTKLPPKSGSGGWYMGQVFNVVIRGTH